MTGKSRLIIYSNTTLPSLFSENLEMNTRRLNFMPDNILCLSVVSISQENSSAAQRRSH